MATSFMWFLGVPLATPNVARCRPPRRVIPGGRCGTEREEFELFDRFLEDFEALNVSVDPNGIATGLVRAESSA